MNNRSFLFEGKIRDFEKVILEYQLEIARFSSLSETMANIMAYLSLYQRLTQIQLKYLTKYSKSTISTSLVALIKIDYVRKEKIKNSREYEYYIAPPSQMSIDFVLGSTENEIVFLKRKIKKLNNDNLEGMKGYTLILERLKHILDVFECYQKILETLKNPKAKVNLNLSEEYIKTLSLEDFNLIHTKFDPEIKQIEDDLLEFFMYESAYSTLSEFTLMIYTLFLTRKVLTQERIRELTGLSLGKVSQVVNALIKSGLIKKVDKDLHQDIIPEEIKRQTIYSMLSIKEAFFTSGIISLEEMLKWEDKFQQIKSELTNNKKSLEKLRGYTQVLNYIDKYLDIIPIYKKATSIFSNYLK
ncbi:MAG: hypothetical protein ACFFC3_09075 [Candidatus Odinarchaeota archaeon]